MWDNGAFRFWQLAMAAGQEWDDKPRDWSDYYRWLEPRLKAGRWAVIPDMPGAPSQLNDGLLADWPFGRSWGVPLWHMDGPIERLGRLCESYDMVALGWIGDLKREPVGCDRYRRRMDEVSALFGNTWPKTHMMRGIKVAFDYPFAGADATSLAQNGHRYDSPMDAMVGTPWRGRIAYADRLEGIRRSLPPHRGGAGRRGCTSSARLSGHCAPDQPWLW